MVNEWTRNDLFPRREIVALSRETHERGLSTNGFADAVLDELVGHLNEHHPKPAREVTRDDLPDFGAMGSVMARWKVSYGAVSDVLDAVVAHLNANGGTPVVMGTAANNTLREILANVETDRDRWHRAHAIVEQECDTARERAVAHARGATEANLDRDKAYSELAAMTRERDEALEASALFQRDVHEWRTRAEAAEARTAPAVSYQLHQPDGTHMDASHLPIFADDDPAEARTTRTVTRDEVEKAIRDAFEYGGTVGEVRQMAAEVCALLGVEAESADPVEAKARELAGVMHEAIKDERVEWHTAPAAVDAMAARLAAHVLGQEDRHVDQ